MAMYKVSLSTIHSSGIKSVFETLKDIMGDVNIHWKKNQVLIGVSSHDDYIFAKLEIIQDHVNETGSYICNEEIISGIYAPSFYKLVKQINKGDEIEINVNPGSIHLKIESGSDSPQKNYSKELRYKTRDITDEELDCNDLYNPRSEMDWSHLNYMFTLGISSSEFTKYIKDSLSTGSILVALSGFHNPGTTSGSITIETKEGTIGDVSITVRSNLVKSSVTGNISFDYSTKFLNMMTKASSLNQTMEISFVNTPTEENICYFSQRYNVSNIGTFELFLKPEEFGEQ